MILVGLDEVIIKSKNVWGISFLVGIYVFKRCFKLIESVVYIFGQEDLFFLFSLLGNKEQFWVVGADITQSSVICLDYVSDHSVIQEKDKDSHSQSKFSILPIRLFKPSIFYLSGKLKYLARVFKPEGV